MSNRRVTIFLLLAAIVPLLLWEGWTLVNNEAGDTISAVLRDAAFTWPIIPFVVGLLIGHFWWPNNDGKK